MLYNKLMLNKSSKQTGSMHIIAISIIVLALVGVLGFVLWNNYINKKGAAPTNESKTDTQTATIDKTTPTPTPSPSQNVITIRELGISITVPDSIKDLTYTYKASGVPTKVGGNNIIVGTVNFSTTSLTANYPECSSDKANPLGGLTKITGTYEDGVLGPTWSGGGVAKQFSDSFLTFAAPQAACFSKSAGSGDQEVGVRVSTQITALSNAIKDAKEL